MTLTQLRYIVALFRERHFGGAAGKSFVSQPTLSVAVKKLDCLLRLHGRGAIIAGGGHDRPELAGPSPTWPIP